MTISSTDLTPWELRNGRWYKREDLYRNGYGVNGAKYRACRHMMVQAIVNGYDHVVSAQSVLSPQSPIVATLAEELGMGCTLVIGASKLESAMKHPTIRIAVEAGAMLDTTCRVAYNGVIQPYAKRLAESLGAWQLPYAISMPDDASETELQAFLEVSGAQVANLPDELKTLVIPFGSGNTTAGVLYGLSRFGWNTRLERFVLVGVGPDRSDWLRHRLDVAGATEIYNQLQIDVMPLHPWFAEYGDKMPETVDDIVMHPTYEGKVARFLNGSKLDWWHNRDRTTGLWIVGGPIV
jgi:1-aminocyclopropane-1-carboxylate deaminase/D-cysteine desulfhydrase-like pyridoxal-dependent ACC family enzyme